MTPRGWWSRNRVALVVLPLTWIAAMIGSSQWVNTYYWQDDLRSAVQVEPGKWAEFSDTYLDSKGEHRFELRARLDGISPAKKLWGSDEPVDAPEGTRAIAVEMTLSADPDAVLSGCLLAVRDDQDRRFDYLVGETMASQATYPCLLPNRIGPSADILGTGGDEGRPRPRTWTVRPVIMVPEDAEITEVNLWWSTPDYLALKVRG